MNASTKSALERETYQNLLDLRSFHLADSKARETRFALTSQIN
jgi:hypothetical protein